MENNRIYAALLELVDSFGVEVRSAPPSGDFASSAAGALVKLKGKNILFLDKSAPMKDRISIIASVLHGREELQNQFLPPEIRDIIENSGNSGA